MSDLRLRDLEREWRNSGLGVDELAWLRARIRAGELLGYATYRRLASLDAAEAELYLRGHCSSDGASRSMLRLAAYCGHAPALSIAGDPHPPADLIGWGEGLAQWGGEALLRAYLGIGLELAAGARGEAGDRMSHLARACEACLLRPTASGTRSVEQAASAITQAGDTFSEVVDYAPSVASMAGRDVSGAMILVVEALCTAEGLWGDGRSAAEHALLEWSLARTLPPAAVPGG